MAKRKAVIKNIIYELDNDDIEISSEDEVTVPKVTRLEPESSEKGQDIVVHNEPNGVEVLSVDSTGDSICLIDPSSPSLNGGKSSADAIVTAESPNVAKDCEDNSQVEIDDNCAGKNDSDDNKLILNDNTEIDSPCIGVAGCENRTPVVTVQFKSIQVPKECRSKIKNFIINMLRKHKGDNKVKLNNDSDEELDIWSEDLVENSAKKEIQQEVKTKEVVDDLFFLDTAPSNNLVTDIPRYGQVSAVLSNVPETNAASNQSRRPQKCFNCGGAHSLRECRLPKNHVKIAEQRSLNMSNKSARYHVEDGQKYGHLIPGRISGPLRNALGLNRNEIPLHVYRMRLLGYPPGWLEEARISHSGIAMFDSSGSAVLDPEEEDGELCEAGSKDKFDIKKILDFPGFNVPASSRYTEEAHLYGLPPISEQDSKIAMLQMLAPNAMKAYKRKRLTVFPSAHRSPAEGQVEMDLDSGDEEAVFPLVPPLPDEVPPPPPPPPDQPPPPPTPPAPVTPAKQQPNDEDVEITSVMQVGDIPIPEDSLIVLDECYDTDKPDSGRDSPSLDDLEKKKKTLMDALEGDLSTADLADLSSAPEDANESLDKKQEIDTKEDDSNAEDNKNESCEGDSEAIVELSKEPASPVNTSDVGENNASHTAPPVTVSTPESKTGHVKATSFGTPVLNIASSYLKVPTGDKFSKQICDVINFENLPDSTGKYKKISSLLKKVKTEVDRIQES